MSTTIQTIHCSRYFLASAQMPTKERAVVKASATGTVDPTCISQYHRMAQMARVATVHGRMSRFLKCVTGRTSPSFWLCFLPNFHAQTP